MIHKIENLPANLAGFQASGDVTKEDFTNTVIPEVERLIEVAGKLNYMLVLDTSIKNFSMGAWFQDAVMGIKNLTKWNRAAIVTDVEGIRIFTSVFSVLIPGEFRGFEHKNLQEAIDWASEKTD